MIGRILWIALLSALGSLVVVLHLLGYAQPAMIVGSRIVNRGAIPLLLAAVFLLPKAIKVPTNAWKKDSVIKWGSLVMGVLGLAEALFYGALMFNVLARFDSEYLAVDSNPIFRMLESRLGHLIAFSAIGSMLWPLIVTGLRDEKLGKLTSPETAPNRN